jgi:hypothetical protein
MYKIHNAYEAREIIKSAGGRWNAEGKFWTLSTEQFAALPAGALASCRVEAPPAPITIVEPINGDRFTLELRTTSTEHGPALAVCAVTERGVIAAWTKCSVMTARRPGSYYSAHRFAKGDTHEQEDFYSEAGITLRVARMVAEQRDAAFAGWYDPTDRKNDEHGAFEAVKGHVAGCCAWFGNTDKKLIKKLEAAQKAAVYTLIRQI